MLTSRSCKPKMTKTLVFEACYLTKTGHVQPANKDDTKKGN